MLETIAGARLFHRSTRSVRPSEPGQAFLQECVDLVGRTNEVVCQMREVTTSLAGRSHVHALPGFALGRLDQMLQQFQTCYQQIVLQMIVNDAANDPVKDSFDRALEIFPPRSEEAVARKLSPVRGVFCATSVDMRRFGTPHHPRDLFIERGLTMLANVVTMRCKQGLWGRVQHRHSWSLVSTRRQLVLKEYDESCVASFSVRPFVSCVAVGAQLHGPLTCATSTSTTSRRQSSAGSRTATTRG